MSGRTWNWLASTRALQQEYFKRDFPIRDPDELADYVIENYTALSVELGEFMQEVGWKTWSAPRGWVNRRTAVGELVDAAHFLANLLCALDVTDNEWEELYRLKQEVNRQRQREGYDSSTTKCPVCRRSYDDVGVNCTAATASDPPYCGHVAG